MKSVFFLISCVAYVAGSAFAFCPNPSRIGPAASGARHAAWTRSTCRAAGLSLAMEGGAGGGGGGGGGGAFREKWLLQKAKTWSNRGGLTLTQHRPNVWAAERPFMWNNIDVGCKATIIKLGDGSLWVHSPVELDDDLRKALADIGGEVKHIVSPNYEHVKFAKQWIDAFPDATAYGCPGAKAKYPSIGYDVEVPTSEGQLPSGWPAEIEPVWFDCEKNPFTGKPFFNEVNFVHTPSKTLLTTDTFWNYPSRDAPFGTRAWKVGMDKIYAPFYKNFMVNPDVFYARVDKLLSLDFTSIIPAHGSSIGGSDDPELSAADDLTKRFGGDVKRLLKSHFSLYGLQE